MTKHALTAFPFFFSRAILFPSTNDSLKREIAFAFFSERAGRVTLKGGGSNAGLKTEVAPRFRARVLGRRAAFFCCRAERWPAMSSFFFYFHLNRASVRKQTFRIPPPSFVGRAQATITIVGWGPARTLEESLGKSRGIRIALLCSHLQARDGYLRGARSFGGTFVIGLLCAKRVPWFEINDLACRQFAGRSCKPSPACAHRPWTPRVKWPRPCPS